MYTKIYFRHTFISLPAILFFPPGKYVWKGIEKACGANICGLVFPRI